MTARGSIIGVARGAAVAVIVLVVGYLAYDSLRRSGAASDAPQPQVFTQKQQVQPSASSAATAGENEGLVFSGAVTIVGPDGSKLSSETGAVFDPETGDLELIDTSTLSSGP